MMRVHKVTASSMHPATMTTGSDSGPVMTMAHTVTDVRRPCSRRTSGVPVAVWAALHARKVTVTVSVTHCSARLSVGGSKWMQLWAMSTCQRE